MARFRPLIILEDGDMSGTITSNTIDLTEFDYVIAHLYFTGSPAGLFYLDVTNTPDESGSWITEEFHEDIEANAAAGNHQIKIEDTQYARIRYVPVEGTGLLTIVLARHFMEYS